MGDFPAPGKLSSTLTPCAFAEVTARSMAPSKRSHFW
nr:MAG TPA: hypothetical protein [Caudoviricetes sp.]